MNWLYVVVLHLRSTEALPLSSSAMAMESEPLRPSTSDQKCKTCWSAWVLHRGISTTPFDHPEWFKPSLQQVRCLLRIPTGWPGSWRKKEMNMPSQGHSAAGWRIHIYEWWKNLQVVCEVRVVSLSDKDLNTDWYCHIFHVCIVLIVPWLVAVFPSHLACWGCCGGPCHSAKNAGWIPRSQLSRIEVHERQDGAWAETSFDWGR